MDHVVDSEACTDCGHDHYPGSFVAWYSRRQDTCSEPGCDCDCYKRPDRVFSRVYKCSHCGRMVTRVTRSHIGGQQCDECYHDE